MEKPELLEKIEPNLELVKTLLTHRDLLNPKTRVLARKIIDKVVQELKQKMQVQVEQAITGAIRKDRHSPRRVFRNLDLKTHAPPQPQNFDRPDGQAAGRPALLLRRRAEEAAWHVIVVVDQSGSMLDSAIFSAVMASIFAELPAVARPRWSCSTPRSSTSPTRSASRSTCCSRSSSAAGPTSPRR